MIGLLAVSGMRIGEPLGLDRDDVDLDAGVLTIRDTQVRQVPAAAAAPNHRHRARALRAPRDELLPAPARTGFFLSARGNRPDKSNVHRIFRDLRAEPGSRGARRIAETEAHDLRHGFAVRR